MYNTIDRCGVGPGFNLLVSYLRIVREQAGAELCQAQFKLGLAKTVFPDVDIFCFCISCIKSLMLSSIYK